MEGNHEHEPAFDPQSARARADGASSPILIYCSQVDSTVGNVTLFNFHSPKVYGDRSDSSPGLDEEVSAGARAELAADAGLFDPYDFHALD